MKIYMDNCCYNRPYDNQSQMRISLETQAKLYVQELIKNGKVNLITSYMLQYENSENPYEMRRIAIARFMAAYHAGFVGAEREPELSEMIQEIMNSGIKYKDAVHVACAIYAKCEFFLTTDVRLLKYQSEKITMLNPIEFVIRWEARTDEEQ